MATKGLQVQGRLGATQGLLEGLAILDRHQVVQDGVNGGGDVVADARHVHEILVDGSEDVRVLEVDVAQALGVEWDPAEEKGNDHHGWRQKEYHHLQ